MLLYHLSPAWNEKSILDIGVCTRFSRGKLAVVWLCCASRVDWALVHVSVRHQRPVTDLVAFKVDVPRGWLTRRRRGVWSSAQDIGYARIRDVLRWGRISEAGVAEG